MSAPLTFVPAAECARLRDNLPALAAAARINCLSAITAAGSGHLGASFSSLDILLWLAVNEPEAAIILSRGHELPAYLAVLHAVGKVPDEALLTLRKPGGIPGHPMPGCLPGIDYSSGSLGMGLSKAKGMILGDRLNGVSRRYYVLVGDAECQEGQVDEAIRACAWNFPEITAVIDRNGYGTDSQVPHPTRHSWAGWGLDTAADGHDFDVFRLVQWHNGQYPAVVFAETTKGRGVSFFEVDPARWHSGAPNEGEYLRAIPELVAALRAIAGDIEWQTFTHTWPVPRPPDPLIEAYSEALCELAAEDERIVVLDADLAKDCGLLPFKERFPARYVECGIAEQDMVSTASGLALRGFVPICHSFAAFLTRRALDQVYNQATEGTRVIYVGSMAGPLPPTGPGRSHQSLFDDSLMTLVGCECYEPTHPESVRTALRMAVASSKPAYIRLCKQVTQ